MSKQNIIQSADGRLFLNDSKRGLLRLFPCTRPKVGDEVYWIDPCFWDGDIHTSRWATIQEVREEMIVLDGDTEVLINELYV